MCIYTYMNYYTHIVIIISSMIIIHIMRILCPPNMHTPHAPTNIVDFRGFDSSVILI